MADEQELLGPGDMPSDMKAQIDEARTERRIEVLSWDLSYRYLAGDQNLDFNPKLQRAIAQRQQPGKNRSVTNQLLQIDRTARSLLSVQFPKLTAAPAAPSYDDITKSLATGFAVKYWWQANRMRQVLNRNNRWLTGAGTAALHVYFDAEKGKVVTESVGAYDLLFEAHATSFEESRWRARRHIYMREVLAATYPDFEAEINEAGALTQIDSTHTAPKDRLEVWEVYFTDGRYGIWLGDTLLFQSRTPKNVMPLIPYRWSTIEGRIYGLSMLFPLLDCQNQINRYKNFALDVADAISNPIWLVPFSSNVNRAHLTNMPGQPVFYNSAGGEPKRLPAPPVPQHLFEIQNRCLSEMMDIAGLHSTSMGKRAPGVTSGVAIDALSERDAGQLRPTMDDIEDAVCEAARVAMVYWQAYIPESRMLRMMDPGMGRVMYKELQGTDLVDDPEVFIEPGSLFAINAEDRDKQLMGLFQAKAIDAKTLLDEMTLHLGNQDAAKKMINFSHAQDLLSALMHGLDVEIFPFDDKEAIRQVFEEYVQSPQSYEEIQEIVTAMHAQPTPELQQQLLAAMGKQDKIVQVLVAMSTPDTTTQQQIEELAESRTYPRSLPPPAPATGMPPGPIPADEQEPDYAAAGAEGLQGSVGQLG